MNTANAAARFSVRLAGCCLVVLSLTAVVTSGSCVFFYDPADDVGAGGRTTTGGEGGSTIGSGGRAGSGGAAGGTVTGTGGRVGTGGSTGGGGASSTSCAATDLVPQATCGTTRNCQATCSTNTILISCAQAGTAPVGGACKTNADCVRGSACFSCTDATMGVCKKYANSDADCPAGSHSTTIGNCGSTAVPFHVCSVSCDPTGTATCAAGQSCIIFTQGVDCACKPAEAIGTDGATCTAWANCRPGFGCTGGFCRPICRVAAPACVTGRTCAPITTDTRFGLCTPAAAGGGGTAGASCGA